MIKLGQFIFRYRNVLGPVVFLVALALSRPHHPFGREDLNIAFDLAGLVLVVAGELLRIATIGYEYIIRGGRDRRAYAETLVQGGIFAHSRNPLYLANISIAIGLALLIHAWAFYLIVIPSILLAYVSIVASEEAYLRAKFGPEFDDYCRRVPRWWLRLAGFSHSVAGMRFNWKRVLVKEYTTVFVLLAALGCLYMWSEYSVSGAGVLPSRNDFIAGFVVWAALYLSVRALKKSGYVRD